jgi:hypothetical protein
MIFASSIARTMLSGRATTEPFQPWVLAGLGWMVLSSALAAVAALTNDTTWHRVLWEAALLGFAGSWIFGVGRRIFPVFLGWHTRWPRIEHPAFLLYQGSVLLWAAGAWPSDGVVFATARAAGAVGLIGAVLLYGATIGVFRAVMAATAPGISRKTTGADPTHGYERYIYAAWLWLFVGLVFGPVWTVASGALGGAGSVLVADFARHAIAFGFVTQTMAGVASRILPVFTGNPLWSPRLRTATFWLINLAVAMRGVEVVVALGFAPGAWPWIALSGPPAVLAVTLFAVNVGGTMASRGRRTVRTPAGTPVADRLVAEIIDIPGALDILVEAGFTPLRQPLMRVTFARTVTLRQACRLRNVELQPLADRIEKLPALRRSPRTIQLKQVASR